MQSRLLMLVSASFAHMQTLQIICFVLLGLSSLHAQHRVVAPVEERDFAALTSYQELREFLKCIDCPTIRVDSLGQTRQGRGVFVAKVSSSVFGADKKKLRVMLFAQQHGDEPSGKEAMTLLLGKFASGNCVSILSTIDLLIVPQMNPDGSELRQRRTSENIDLNRNHVLLTSPETRTLHDLFDTLKPHVTVDIHEYGSFSSDWSDSGFIKIADVQLGMLTNLNTSRDVRELQHDQIYPFIAGRMKDEGYSFQEYIVGSPGTRVRHSTTEINDGRQSFGILGTVSFIQEGRKWKTQEDQLRRCALSQLTSIEALLEYCSKHAREIRKLVLQERRRLVGFGRNPVAIRMDHYAGKNQLLIPVRNLKTESDTTWRVNPYHGKVRLVKNVLLPNKYVLLREDSSIVALLHRHHINVDTVWEERSARVSSYVIDTVGQTVLEEDTIPLLSVSSHKGVATLNRGDFLVSTRQLQSVLLAVLLEPESNWGLTKYDAFSFLRAKKKYPVFRIH